MQNIYHTINESAIRNHVDKVDHQTIYRKTMAILQDHCTKTRSNYNMRKK